MCSGHLALPPAGISAAPSDPRLALEPRAAGVRRKPAPGKPAAPLAHSGMSGYVSSSGVVLQSSAFDSLIQAVIGETGAIVTSSPTSSLSAKAERERSADILVCGFTGHSCPVFR